MSEVFQDIRDYFADRFSSPFWISFIVTWLVINWELPITAIFETDKFSVTFISEYLAKTQSWYKWQLPTLLAITYAIFSSSVKEIIDILSKLIRSIFSYVDRKGTLYRSISLIEHEKEIARLERRLQKENNSKEQLVEYSQENTILEKEIESLKLELKNRQDYEEQNNKLSAEINELRNIIDSKNKEPIRIKFSKQQEKSEADNNLTYIQKIKTHCNQETITLLEDPDSRANMLLMLESFGNSTPYSANEIKEKSGMPKEIYNKIFNHANDSGLMGSSHGQIILTEAGQKKLKELRNDENFQDLIEAINAIDSQTTNEIISILEKKSLTLTDMQNTVSYNQNLLKILKDLISKNIIHKIGKLYFYGPSNSQ